MVTKNGCVPGIKGGAGKFSESITGIGVAKDCNALSA